MNLIGDQAVVEQFPNNIHPASVVTYNQNDYYGDKSTEVASYVPSNNAQMGCCEWSLDPAAYNTASFANGFPYGFSGSQSDGDLTPSGSGSANIGGATRQH